MRKPVVKVSDCCGKGRLQRKPRTRLQREVQDLVDRRNLLVRRRVQYNDNAPDQTDGTANLAQQSQLLVEEIAAQDGTNKHTQRAKRRDKNGRRKGVGREVEDLAEDHGDDAGPPCRIAQVRVAVAIEAVLLHRRIEALLCDDETGADGERGRDGQAEPDVSGRRVSMRYDRWCALQRTCLPPCCLWAAIA